MQIKILTIHNFGPKDIEINNLTHEILEINLLANVVQLDMSIE